MAVYDQTSFSKYLVTGPDAESALQWLCTNDVAVPPGRTVYTGLLNDRGTYESDITVTRLSAEEFLLVASAATTERDSDHIRRRMPPGSRATLVDVTSAYAVYGVMGPRSRELLARLSRRDLSDAAFRFGSSALIDLGYSTVRATRITYVGELGWELYVPAEFAVGVYEDLMAAGEDLGAVNAGYYAIESLRLEKGYRAFGRELTPDYNPVEAGPAVRLQARHRGRLPGPGGGGEGQGGRAAPPPGLAGAARSRRHDVGRRAHPARRRAGRPGDLGGLGRDGRRRRGPGLHPRPGGHPGDRRICPNRGVPGQRRRPASLGRGRAAGRRMTRRATGSDPIPGTGRGHRSDEGTVRRRQTAAQ